MNRSSKLTSKKFGHRYPWARWFSRRSFTIHAGTDYHVTTAAMAGNVRMRASRLRKSVSLDVGDSHIHVTVVGDLPCRK